jgi:hypothetical protein
MQTNARAMVFRSGLLALTIASTMFVAAKEPQGSRVSGVDGQPKAVARAQVHGHRIAVVALIA